MTRPISAVDDVLAAGDVLQIAGLRVLASRTLLMDFVLSWIRLEIIFSNSP